MAYQFAGVCYSDAPATLSAMASAVSGSVVDVGGSPYALDVTVNGSALVYSGSRLDDVGTFVKSVTVTLQDCQLIGVADAQVLIWGVGALWAAAYVWVSLRRGV